MNAIKRFGAVLSIAVLFGGIGLVAPASAHIINEDSSSTDSSRHNHIAVEDDAEDPHNSDKSSTMRDQFKAIAQQEVADKKAHVKQQTDAARQKACNARKTNLSKRMSNSVKRAQAHKEVFDKIYAKVKAFHDNKNLTVANYDSLVAAADAAQSDAEASIIALQSLDISVDCTSSTVAESVGAFQQAVKATRDSLKSYRSSIVDITKELKASATDGEDQ